MVIGFMSDCKNKSSWNWTTSLGLSVLINYGCSLVSLGNLCSLYVLIKAFSMSVFEYLFKIR